MLPGGVSRTAPIGDGTTEPLIDALARGDERQALLLALDAWRRRRLPRLAAVVEWLSARLGPVEPVHAQRAWCDLAKARDAFALPGLLATLTAATFSSAEARVRALAGWEDPRITTAFLGVLSAPRYRSSGANWFYERFYAVLEAQRDPRAAPRLRGLAERYHEVVTNSYGPRMARDMRAVAERLEASAPGVEVDAATGAWLDEVERNFAAELAGARRAKREEDERAGRAATWEARVAERPDDDDLRQVWADVLVELGDPRGELLNFQLMERRGGLSAAQLEQLRLVQSRHRDRLLGTIAPKVVNAVFDRGVAVHVELGRGFGVPSLDEPGWRFVRGVTLPAECWETEAWAAALARLPRVDALMRVDPRIITRLLESRPGLELEHALMTPMGEFDEEALPPVRHALVRSHALVPLLRRARAERVTLEVAVGVDPAPAVKALEGASARRVRWVDGVHLMDPEGFFGWSFELDQAERRLDVRGRFSRAPDLERLEVWRRAFAPLGCAVHFHTALERDALYTPLIALPATVADWWASKPEA